MFAMVDQICADTRSKAAGRYLSFNALRQSSPCKSDQSEGQLQYLRTPASNLLAGMPTRSASFSLYFANIEVAMAIILKGPAPEMWGVSGSDRTLCLPDPVK